MQGHLLRFTFIGVVGIFSLVVYLAIWSGLTPPDYTPPLPNSSLKTKTTLDKSYGETWDELVSFVSSRPFAIESYEKESGLMVLSFSSEEPSRFINCGNISTDFPVHEGDYVKHFNEHPSAFVLDGQMNVNVRGKERTTTVDVNAGYAATVKNNVEKIRQWNFSTGGSETKQVTINPFGINQTRTCQPTHEAESIIIEGIKN